MVEKTVGKNAELAYEKYSQLNCALMDAIRDTSPNIEKVRRAYEAGANINALTYDWRRWTPLSLAEHCLRYASPEAKKETLAEIVEFIKDKGGLTDDEVLAQLDIRR